MSEDALVGSEPLFYERGASWYWLLAGPVSGLTMLRSSSSRAVAACGGSSVFLVLVSGFLSAGEGRAHPYQRRAHRGVAAAKTPRWSRCTIVGVYPGAPTARNPVNRAGEVAVRQGAGGAERGAARAHRYRAAAQRRAHRQAWARNHRELRAQLTKLVEDRTASSS